MGGGERGHARRLPGPAGPRRAPAPCPARVGDRRGCPEPRPHLRRLRSHRPALTASRPAERRRRSSSSSSSAGSRRDLLLPLQRAQSLLANTGLPLPPFTPASPHLSAQRGAPSSRFPCPGAAQPRSAPRRRLQKPPGASPFKWTRSIPPSPPLTHTHTHMHTYMHTHTQTHTLLLFSLPFFLSRFAHFLQSEFILQTRSLHNCPPHPRTHKHPFPLPQQQTNQEALENARRRLDTRPETYLLHNQLPK